MLRLPFDAFPDLLTLTSDRERALHQKHFEMLQDWNTRMALVSRKSIDKSFESHYVDSIYTSKFAHQYYEKGTVYDLGSGAGFPGVFFAIRYPKIPVVLFERVQKKQKFLQEVISQLQLENARLLGEWQKQRLQGLFLARAVTPREELLAFFQERVSPGSVLILNSGGEADTSKVPGTFVKLAEESYQLPKDAGVRKIEAVRKVRN